MSRSKYKPKVALGSSDKLIEFKTREDIEKYVRKVNPYRTRSGSAVKGVVPEAVNYLTYFARKRGKEVTSLDVDEYFKDIIPNSYQQSGEYISEMVSLWQKEHEEPSKNVTQEELTFIRERLKSKLKNSGVVKLHIPKSEARKRDNSLRTSFKDAYENEDGSVTLDVNMSKEMLGGYIGKLWDESKKLRIKDQFTKERLKETLKGNMAVDDKLIDYLSKHGLELITIKGKPLTKRMSERKIWDVTAEINHLVRQMFNPEIVELCGEYSTVEDLDSAMMDKLDEKFGKWGEGNKTRDDYSQFFRQFKNRLLTHTSFKVYPLVMQAVLKQMDSMSDDELKSAMDKIYEKNLLPDDEEDFYKPAKLSGWVAEVLGLFSVDKNIIGAIQSTAYEEDEGSSLLEKFGAHTIFTVDASKLSGTEYNELGEKLWNRHKGVQGNESKSRKV